MVLIYYFIYRLNLSINSDQRNSNYCLSPTKFGLVKCMWIFRSNWNKSNSAFLNALTYWVMLFLVELVHVAGTHLSVQNRQQNKTNGEKSRHIAGPTHFLLQVYTPHATVPVVNWLGSCFDLYDDAQISKGGKFWIYTCTYMIGK